MTHRAKGFLVLLIIEAVVVTSCEIHMHVDSTPHVASSALQASTPQ